MELQNNEIGKEHEDKIKQIIGSDSNQALQDLLEQNNRLQTENEKLNNLLKQSIDKYESLRDIDSPIKEISQMKNIKNE